MGNLKPGNFSFCGGDFFLVYFVEYLLGPSLGFGVFTGFQVIIKEARLYGS